MSLLQFGFSKSNKLVHSEGQSETVVTQVSNVTDMPVGPTVERDPAIKTFDSLDDEIKHEPVINNYELRKDRPYWSRIQNRMGA